MGENEDRGTKVSVSQEIRRFQEEIDKVQQENTSFYRWKLRRATTAPRPRVRTILTSAVSTESLLSSAHGKKGKGNKKVSYCEAVTVFGSSESLGLGSFLLVYYLLC
jgi:hypothetical protein